MSIWPYKYFQPKELLSWHEKHTLNYNSGLYQLEVLGRNPLQDYAVKKLEIFRKDLGLPLHCNHAHLHYRGYRNDKENRRIGGASKSKHKEGIAFDLNCYKLKLVEFWLFTIMYSGLSKGKHGPTAIGIYPDKNFMHIDFRPLKLLDYDYLLLWSHYDKKQISCLLPLTEIKRDSASKTLDNVRARLPIPKKWRLS